MNSYFFFFILLISTCSLFGQRTYDIHGQILKENTEAPIPGTTIFFSSKGNFYGTSTDENGYFQINNLSKGTYEIAINDSNYQSKKETIIVTDNNEPLLFFLTPIISISEKTTHQLSFQKDNHKNQNKQQRTLPKEEE
ncbi:carboxypeptidase-like regulatory domain-containing protein [Aquimarina sp. TRL1]|uniref:carboxypeptidase-like regulatory domain-containing protein n=1 Tax=Aquimarina sp. (strain TRL1) TaxID=2736252 RepID=UPI00158F140A|nr:carboxypeptidase-like regulatory domain-containing protein [Aquimarina sp. TRL1]QKX04433.1 carboxypeptidase-like regulatory domain-containing protein [Aquimarina sp. TRL1]